MKKIKDALKKVEEEKTKLRIAIAKCCPVGSIIMYKHGCHAIEAEVISYSGRFGCGVMWVKGLKSGREYTLHPNRIENVV